MKLHIYVAKKASNFTWAPSLCTEEVAFDSVNARFNLSLCLITSIKANAMCPTTILPAEE